MRECWRGPPCVLIVPLPSEEAGGPHSVQCGPPLGALVPEDSWKVVGVPPTPPLPCVPPAAASLGRGGLEHQPRGHKVWMWAWGAQTPPRCLNVGWQGGLRIMPGACPVSLSLDPSHFWVSPCVPPPTPVPALALPVLRPLGPGPAVP